jgi:aryl-alcohol dehydrogenase-like predicted oxidoreductase
LARPLELHLPAPFELPLALTVEGPLAPGLTGQVRRIGFGPGVLVVQHASTGPVGGPIEVRVGVFRVLVVEVSGPTHPAMLVEPPGDVQYPAGFQRYLPGSDSFCGMRYVEVGGVRLSVVGLGTWQFGSPEWGYGRAFAEGEALRITQRALDLGINLIDTAEIYGFGRSERAVGEAIAGRRGDVFIATKVTPVLPFDPIVHQRALSSLRRLGVDRIDLYQAHWPNPVFPPGPIFEALGRLQREGVVTHVGVSNYSLSGWQVAERLLGGPVFSNQVQYNLVDRRPEQELVPWAQEHDRLIMAYSPLAQGLLSGGYSSTKRPGAMRGMKPLFFPPNLELATELIDAVRDVAIKNDATPAQVALAWLIRQPNVVVIPGASSVAQLESNAAAADLDLSDEDEQRLRAASERFRPLTGLNAVSAMMRTRLPI